MVLDVALLNTHYHKFSEVVVFSEVMYSCASCYSLAKF